jgi:hypothetical protein
MQQGTHVITEVIVTLDIIYVGSKAFKMTREVRAALTDRTADADAGNPTTSAGSQTGAVLDGKAQVSRVGAAALSVALR